jgi:NADPH:quinone reductase-like Zn-dependent oxidoreductase
MQAVLLPAPGKPPTVGTLPVPQPGPGQVLIRLAAAPINPSDLGFIQGSYDVQAPFPLVPGFEGSGTVVAAGSGLLPRLWLGKRVVCGAPPGAGGAWAEYLVTSATSCVPLVRRLSLEQGATLIVNPMTALAFFDIARREHHAALVSNAAASAVGRMILRLGQLEQMPIIHVVRRAEQVKLLRALGGEYVLNSSDPDFLDHLQRLASQLHATLLLDPVAGAQAQRLLDTAPDGSTLLMYGSLSGQQSEPVLQSTGAGNKQIKRFFLPEWIAQQSPLQVFLKMRQVQRLATQVFQTNIQKRLSLSAVEQAIALAKAHPTAGKVLLVADQERVPVDQEN